LDRVYQKARLTLKHWMTNLLLRNEFATVDDAYKKEFQIGTKESTA